MKKSLVFLFCVSQLTLASNPDVDACLKAWGKHPFGKKYQYRTMGTSVKILGIGKSIDDDVRTEKPELILVKPSVAVLTKQNLRLLNPNGWYCLKVAVTVLGKSEITMHCDSHIASTDGTTTIAGASDTEHGGVTVLGTVRIKREGCKD